MSFPYIRVYKLAQRNVFFFSEVTKVDLAPFGIKLFIYEPYFEAFWLKAEYKTPKNKQSIFSFFLGGGGEEPVVRAITWIHTAMVYLYCRTSKFYMHDFHSHIYFVQSCKFESHVQ